MAIDLLDTFLSLPLEREHEGWISERILEYFEASGVTAYVWAVSPADESTWPADEHVWMPGKVFGLQFKRAYLDDPLQGEEFADYHRLYWPLDADPDQFRLVCKRPEIFYCLPTFTNRRCRKVPLHHCLYWRPSPRTKPSRAWYDNSQANQKWARNLERHPNSYRWGNLIERIQQCDFGEPVGATSSSEYLEGLKSDVLEIARRTPTVGPASSPGMVQPLILVNVKQEVHQE